VAKSPAAFRTISEVADWLDTPAHVLRFWESRFSQVKPVKRAGGRRYYRPADMLLLGGIKKLLHVDGMTIKGAQKMLRTDGVKKVSALSQPIDAADDGAVVDMKPATAPKKKTVTAPPLQVVEAKEPTPIIAAEKPQPEEVTAPAEETVAPPTNTATKANANTKEDSKPSAGPDTDNDSLSSVFDRLTALHSRMKSDIDPKLQG
jgi:DNA-binding transcriptional MerR regulator